MVTGRVRPILIGLLLIPLSMLPFLGYSRWTPEGRFLTDRISARLDPPHVPVLDEHERAEARAAAASYTGAVMPLVYHGIGSTTDGEGSYALTPQRFAEQLAWLRAAGMQFVTAREVAAAFDGGPPLPERAVMISFDDGRADALLWATPLLKQVGAVATMFVITDEADDPNTYYASWDALQRSGVWDLESHTASLHHQVRVDGATIPATAAVGERESIEGWKHRVDLDLDRADAAIARETGRRPVAFAYPFGAWGGDDRTNDPRVAPAMVDLIAQHYRLAFHQDHQDEMRLADPSSPQVGIQRLEVGDWSGEDLVHRIWAAALRTFEERVADYEAGQPPQ
jgi:peptidoglycan/xylan/chitin deacetylase (PgdA/CDA1 family)